MAKSWCDEFGCYFANKDKSTCCKILIDNRHLFCSDQGRLVDMKFNGKFNLSFPDSNIVARFSNIESRLLIIFMINHNMTLPSPPCSAVLAQCLH